MDLLDAVGDCIRASRRMDVEHMLVPVGEWELMVEAWNREHDQMNEAADRQDAREDNRAEDWHLAEAAVETARGGRSFVAYLVAP